MNVITINPAKVLMRKLFLLTAMLPMATAAHAQTVIAGGGNYINGVVFYLGVHSGSSSGFSLAYDDAASDVLKFHSNRLGAWLWENYDGSAIWPSMRLDLSNRLILYNGTAEGVKLDPASGGKLTLGGSSGAVLTATGSSLTTNGNFSVTGTLTATGNLNFTGVDGSFATNSSGISIAALAGNKSITLSPGGSGNLLLAPPPATGNVGIKTLVPDKSLHVSFDSATVPAVKIGSGTDAQGWYTFLGNDTAALTTSYIGNAYNNDAAAFQIRMKGTAVASARLSVLGNGNVGIGTTNPLEKLEVAGGAIKTSGASVGMSRVVLQSTAVGGQQYEWYNDVLGPGSGVLGLYNRTSSSLPIVFAATGNVGIGASSPGAKLQVGSWNLIKDGTWADPTTPGFVSAGERLILFEQAAWKTGIGMGGQNDLWFQAHTPSGQAAFRWFTGGASAAPVEKMRVMDNGNVGIGTTSPGSKLDVAGQGQYSVDGVGADTASYGTLGVTRAASANTLSYFAMTRSGNAVKAMGIDASNRWVFGVTAPGTQIIATPQMVIEQTGNVGIGTTTPTQKLSVNGTIRAKEVIVDTGWSDYVFDESYRLAPLSEVEARIKADNHLPGIPSATEIAEHG